MSSPTGVYYNGERETNPDLSSYVLSAGGDDSHVIDYPLGPGGSAITAFFDAVKELNNNHNQSVGVLKQAADAFGELSNGLAAANPRLSSGWAENANLCNKLDQKIQEILSVLIADMNRYAELVNKGELEEVQALEETNAVTNSLLNELNGI